MREATVTFEDNSLETSTRNSEVPKEELSDFPGQNTIEYIPNRRASLRARYYYGTIFLATNLTAWIVRDYGQKLFLHSHYLNACGFEGHDCFHTMGVLRVSFGCFIFFFFMLLTTIKGTKLYEVQNAWHSGFWPAKFVLLAASITSAFFFPPDFIQLYGEFARIGAGIFLLLQLISVIHFIAWWNNYWMPDEERKQSCSLGIFVSTISYITSACGLGLMYKLYIPSSSCMLNIFFITWTAVLLMVMMAVSLHSKVNRGLLSSGIMSLYVVFSCWSAIRRLDSFHAVSFLIAICAIVAATFSTGIDSESFQFRRDEAQEDDDIPYNYVFFHLVFSLGAMYFAMLFISWNLNHSTRRWSIDTGWASVWVKILNEWLAATLYVWKLISPVLRQAKVTNQEAAVQQTNIEAASTEP